MEIYVPYEFSICSERRGSEVYEMFHLVKKQKKSNLLFQDCLASTYVKLSGDSENDFNEKYLQRLLGYAALDDLYIQTLIDFSLRAHKVFLRWPALTSPCHKLYELNLLTLSAKEVNLGVMRYLPNGVYSDVHHHLWSQIHELFIRGLKDSLTEKQLLDGVRNIEDVLGRKPLGVYGADILSRMIVAIEQVDCVSVYKPIQTDSKVFALFFMAHLFEDVLLDFISALEEMTFHQAKSLLSNNENLAQLHYDAFFNNTVPG
jgi:hypothetical protein